MSCPITKQSLSPGRQQLIELMQDLQFGRIEGLEIRDGEPVLEPAPRLVRDIKLGRHNGSRIPHPRGDFAIKTQVADLLAQLARLGNGIVETLVVQNGLPFRIVMEEPARS